MGWKSFFLASAVMVALSACSNVIPSRNLNGHLHPGDTDAANAGALTGGSTDGGGSSGGSVTPPTGSVTPPAAPASADVTFAISAGTGNQPWNTGATAVQGKVGAKITIKNNDTMVHRVHTNGAPFPHGADIAAGASVTYTLGSAFDNTATGANTYDHYVGTSAKFYMKIVP